MLPGGIGFYEMMVFAVVAILLFGSKLPNVARSVGQSYQQFRKGLTELQNSIKIEDDKSSQSSSSYSEPSYNDRYDDYDEPAAPQFKPPADED